MSNPAATSQEIKQDDGTRIVGEIGNDKLVELESGMSGEREQLPGMPKEYSGWDVYNNEAKKVDTELVNDWRDSLNSLLLFAAIFAAVLTAFIIESKKLLESDPSDAMLEVMIFFTNSMANGSFTPYPRPQFEPETSSVTINCLFFASLSASLVAALASVVALQWVADYDAAITRGGSSPENRAKRRQFRYAGVVRWKMSGIIATLPLLLYSSVVLFFIGLTLWMWTVHHTVGAVVAGGMGIAVLFYGATTLLSVASVSASFRTPLSRLIYSSIYLFFLIVDSLSRFSPIPSSQAWLKERHQRYTGAVKRDNNEVDRRDCLGVDALSWLASHLSISQDSYDRLLLLVNELRKQDQTHFATPRFNEAPWFSIFDLLGWRNLNTAGPDDRISKEEMRAVAILAHCYTIPMIYAIIRPKEEMLYYSDDTVDAYWSQYCNIARAQWSQLSPSTGLNSLFLLLRDVPLPTKDTTRQIECSIRFSRWRNSILHVQGPSKDEAYTPPSSSSTSVVVVGQFLKTDTKDLWVTRGVRSLYLAAIGRMVNRYVENGEKMASILLEVLYWRFESLLLGEGGYAMEGVSLLSRPQLDREIYQQHKTEYGSLHSDFTLLFARNLHSFSGAERARRVKEVLTMMWVSSGHVDSFVAFHQRQRMESFFDANRKSLNNWVHNLDGIPYSLAILEHLSLAQAKQPTIGSLWRAVNSQVTLLDLLPALRAFDSVIAKGVTPEQHGVLIDLVCRDIELSAPGAFREDVDSHQIWVTKALQDPCLKLIGGVAAGDQVKLAEDTNLPMASWIRTANHLMKHYEGADSPIMLRLQASAWFIVPNYVAELCGRALHEPQALARVKRIFEYPVQCHRPGHDIGEGHLLLHILPHIANLMFPVEIPALTEFPMKGQHLHPILTVLILSDGYEDFLREQMNKQDDQCTTQLLEMVGMLISSQFSMLAILSAMRFSSYPHDLAGFSICVNKALDLPDDQRAASLIRPLLSLVQALIDELHGGSTAQREISRREAAKTIERLCAHLERWNFLNSSMLSCVRATGSFDHTIGWLPPYTDRTAIF